MPTLRLDYPALTKEHGTPIFETVEAELRREGDILKHYERGIAVAELRAHAIYIPLAPGDVVTYNIDTDEPVELIHRAPVWTMDVDFMLPGNLVTGQPLADDDPAQVTIREVTAVWQREAWVTQHTGLSFYVSAQDRDWLEDRVTLCEYVDHVEWVRTPDMPIDLAIARDHADLGDLTKGPWS